ncbi:MAG: hypothetical protein J6X18_00050 [Bacteroidales bacterium]|nr:hypothetical protein [Bacteroidales bacterium]
MVENNYRERTCNFCDFSERCGIPDGVLCSEEHHQEGKDMFQYYGHRGCEYFSDEKGNDSYGLEESRRKSHEENLRARYEYLCSEIGRTREKLAELEKELSELNNED